MRKPVVMKKVSLAGSPEKGLVSGVSTHTALGSLVVSCTALGGKLEAIPSDSRYGSWFSDVLLMSFVLIN